MKKKNNSHFLKKVKLEKVDFEPYKKLTPKIYDSTIKEAKKTKRRTIIHVNSTEKGGGVAEMLSTYVPLQASLGFDVSWYTLHAVPEFYEVTKKIHNGLQGNSALLDDKEKETYLKSNRLMGQQFGKILEDEDPAIVVIHDPQPLPFIDHIPAKHKAILRLHIDLSTPNVLILDFLRSFIEKYPAVMVSSSLYRPAWLALEKTHIVFPAIDPFSEKNIPMSIDVAKNIISGFGIHTDRHLISQISRFDPWKDPLGVIKAYRKARNKIPGLQLVLAGFFAAKDDPEAIHMFETVKKHAQDDADIHLFEDLEKLGDITNDTFVNALQTASTIVMQKSTREGFGLTVTEAMWKGKAVIGGNATGILNQIEHEKNGLIASSISGAARAIVTLIQDEKLRDDLGRAAKKTVSEDFLMSRLLLEHFKTYNLLDTVKN